MARLLFKCCVVVFLTMTFHTASQGATTGTRWYYSTRGPTSPAIPCSSCPACPSGYYSANVNNGYGCPRCLCEWSGQSGTTAYYPDTTIDFSQNLLMKILLNLGHNADAVNRMASSLDEEAQIAGDVAKYG